ncbi:MAG TPA: GxxExxY protein [Cyclobacteriaceae bacterium]|nr:GxxExxY protein [Cyclobacteriaceae bacterium]
MLKEELTYKIKGAIYSVFRELGPGLFESVYERALALELKKAGLLIEAQVPVPAYYKGESMDIGFKIDLLVDDEVIIEVKSVAELHDVHKKQLLTYLRLTGKRVGFLVNFNSAILKDNINLIRIVN